MGLTLGLTERIILLMAENWFIFNRKLRNRQKSNLLPIRTEEFLLHAPLPRNHPQGILK